jgi:hypothetical protein
MALVDDAIRGNMTRGESLKALGSLAASSTALYYALCKGLGQEPQLDPSQPGRFMTIKVGNSRVGLGGFHSALLRFMISAAADPNDIIQVDDWQDSSIVRFFRGRSSIPTSITWDVLSRQTYMGEPLEDYGTMAKEEILRRTLPFWITDYLDEPRPGLAELPAQFFGLRGFAMSYSESRDILRNKYARQEFGGDWGEINKLQQRQLLDIYPDLAEMTELAEIRYSERGGPKAKEWRAYKTEMERVNQYIADNLADAAAAYDAGVTTGSQFRMAVDEAYSQGRAIRDMMEGDDRFTSVFAYFNDPSKDTSQLPAEDAAYAEYCTMLYSKDLIDEYGRYKYDLANQRKQDILKKYGPDNYQYIQERLAYGKDVPEAVRMLQQARETLKSYWAIEDQVWAMFPPQLKTIADQIKMLESTDPDTAKRLLKRYPGIVRARKLIAMRKKQMRTTNREIDAALAFYR